MSSSSTEITAEIPLSTVINPTQVTTIAQTC